MMTIPAFDPKELNVVGQTFSMYGPVPLYDFPVTQKEAYMSLMKDRKPIWQLTGIENHIFTPRIIPDNVARAFCFEAQPFDANTEGGGKDMFGVEWEYVPAVGGSMVRPGKPMIEDMNDWEKILVWPDINSWDWEGSSKLNKEMLDKSTNNVQIWIQNGWFERIISFMEFENAALALIDEDQQDAVKAFFDKLSDLYIAMIDKYVEYFPQVNSFFLHDDWGAQKETFFSPSVVEEMIVPYMRKVTDHIHKLGRIAELHSCGQILRQVPNMIAAGWDTWNPQIMNDTDKIYQDYGDKIIVGVVPEQFDPEKTTEEEQRKLAREFAAKYCNPDKPCMVNYYAVACLTPAYREELYKESRIRFGK